MPSRTTVVCALVTVAFHAAPVSAHAVKADRKLVGTEFVIVAYFATLHHLHAARGWHEKRYSEE